MYVLENQKAEKKRMLDLLNNKEGKFEQKDKHKKEERSTKTRQEPDQELIAVQALENS
jgi:hypothetical protein